MDGKTAARRKWKGGRAVDS